MKWTGLKAVLFDMDDTLIDWRKFNGDWRKMERRHIRNVFEFLASKDRPLQADLDTVLYDYGTAIGEQWEDARTTLRAPHIGRILIDTLSRYGFEPDDHITMDDCLTAYGWTCVPGVEVFADVPDGLQLLIDRGVQIGIVTNASQPMSMRDRELHEYDLLKYFPVTETRISAADVGYLKPHPRIFEHALGVVDAAPHEAVYVGDNPGADVNGAKQAGMKAVLRINGKRPPLANALFQPDGIISNMNELIALLDEWFGESDS